MLKQIRNRAETAVTSTFLFRFLRPRATHIYCVGTAKSGTHSIAAMFADQLRSAHEPAANDLLDKILAFEDGRIDRLTVDRYLLKRDRRLWLEIDSSQLNFFFISRLVKLFPHAKFLLTIRSPYSWLDSFINHQLARGGSDKWIKFRDLRFRPDVYTHQKEENRLKEMGLYTLDGYLAYWAFHNRTVIDAVPQDRLLVVRTDRISTDAEKIASLVGVSSGGVSQTTSHMFKAKAKYGLLEAIDQDYLEHKMSVHCCDLVTRFFPEIQLGK